MRAIDVASAKRQFSSSRLEVIVQVQKKQIIFRLLGSDLALMRCLFDTDTPYSLRLRDSPEIIFSDAWELNEERRTLVLAALDIWDNYGNVFLWDLLNGL